MNLEATIALHRALMRDELTFSPSQRTPPVAFTWDKVERAMIPDDSPLVINPLKPNQIEVPDSATQSTQVGMPMSSRMLRYLSGPAPDTAWATALKSLRKHCRDNHPDHRRHPAWRGSLCWQLVFMTVVGKPLGDGPATVHDAAIILKYDHPAPILRQAFAYIENRIDEMRQKQELRAREDEGHGPGAVPENTPEHHATPGLHQQDCPQCRKNNVA